MLDAKRQFPGLLLALCSLALAWILQVFFGAILWAVILALILMPVYRRVLRRVRHHRNTAAALCLLAMVLVGVVPFALLTTALSREASAIFQRVDSGEWKPALFLRALFERLPDWLVFLLHHLGIANVDVLLRRIDAALAQGSQFIATQALGIGLSTFGFGSSLGITLYLSFFMLRDGEHLSLAVWRAVPLQDHQKAELRQRFTAVVRATVNGSLIVATIQGTLGGLAFYCLGVQGALLWAMVMSVASLVPVVGTALVWLPVAVFFYLSGDTWKALQLAAYGVVVIGLIDNLLRPALVGHDARLPDYAVMITTLGGLATMGINGLVIGPAIAAVFVAVWPMCMVRTMPRPSPRAQALRR